MDGVVPGSEASQQVSDPHDWNTWENYLMIHEKRMQLHPFVLEDHLAWEIVGDPSAPELITLAGIVICQMSVIVRVDKTLETRLIGNQRLQVRGLFYAYNAYFAGRHNILRYDNGHMEPPEEFHRHQFDLETGVETRKDILEQRQIPVLADFFTEVAQLIGFNTREDA